MGWDNVPLDIQAEEKAQVLLQANYPDLIVLKTEAERKDRSLDWYDMKTLDGRTIEAKFDSHVLDDQTLVNRYTGNTFMEVLSQSGILGGISSALYNHVDIFIYKFMFEDKDTISWKEGSNHDLVLVMDTVELYKWVIKGLYEGHKFSKQPHTSYGILTPISYLKCLHTPKLLEPPVLIRTIRK